MSTKHTPGPWEFLEDGRTEEEFNRGRAFTIGGPRPNNDDLAQVFSRDDATVSVSREEAGANARLMAAAPNLLDGCNAILGLCALLLARDDLPAEVREALADNHRVHEARAAIAKATGAA